MQVLMKRPPTEKVKIVIEGKKKRQFVVPKKKADGLVELLKEFEYSSKDYVSPEEVFYDLHEKYGKGGTVLQGFRHRDELTQKELAKKIRIKQGDISAMENGKRPIGKKMAERLSKVFKTDYRVFL